MKSKFTLFIFLLISAISLSCVTNEVLPELPKIDFTTEDLTAIDLTVAEGQTEFKILQLADTQVSYQRELDPLFNLIQKLVDKAKPDLIVFTGDNTAGSNGTKLLLQIISFMDSLNIPYAASFGNHDNESDSLNTLSDIWATGKNALFKKGPSDKIQGYGNYAINLIQSDEVKHSVYMIDSNQYRTFSLKERIQSKWGGTNYDYIYPSQIAWYEASVNHQNELANKLVPSTAFAHIAIPEHRAYKIAPKENILIPQNKYARDVISGPVVNTGLFAKMKELNSTKSLFVGHDHFNNFAFIYDGIILGYGLKTGRASYHNKKVQGATLLTLTNGFTTVNVSQIWEKDL